MGREFTALPSWLVNGFANYNCETQRLGNNVAEVHTALVVEEHLIETSVIMGANVKRFDIFVRGDCFDDKMNEDINRLSCLVGLPSPSSMKVLSTTSGRPRAIGMTRVAGRSGL